MRGEQADDPVATAVDGNVALLGRNDEGSSERAAHNDSVIFTVRLEADYVVGQPGLGILLTVPAVYLVCCGVLDLNDISKSFYSNR